MISELPAAIDADTDPRAVIDRLDTIWNRLIAPGAEFELERRIIAGRQVDVYARAPATAGDMWRRTAMFGDRPYLVYRDERIDYATAHAQVAATAGWLWQRGVRSGDRVGIAMRNYPEWMLIYWACATIGACVVGMNAWWTAEEMGFGLADTAPKVTFCDAERLDRLSGCPGERPPHVVAVRAGTGHGVTDWSEVIAYRAQPAPDVAVDPDQDLCIFFTSGTTGRAKGARLSHRGCINAMMNIRFNGAVVQAIVGETAGTSEAAASPPVGLVPTPLFHVTANPSLVLPISLAGGTLVLMHKWDVAEALSLIEAERVTVLYGVPTQVRELMAAAEAGTHDMSSLAILSGGGAAVQADLVARVANSDFPVMPSTGFGMTETSGAITALTGPLYVARSESVGRPFPTTAVRLVDDEGREPRPGAPGELWVRGVGVISGYVNAPEASAEAIVDGWLKTGDIARIDADGFVYIVDRKKDMIIRGGENVYCAEVEAALYRHSGVVEACAFGVPDARLGEEVGAAVRFAADAIAPDTAAIRSTLAAIVAKHKIPRHLWVLDRPLPRNANGKFLRRALREMLDLAAAG